MTTNREKLILEQKVRQLVRESLFNNYPQYFREENDNQDRDDSDTRKNTHGVSAKRNSVMKWLKSAQEKHSQLAYELWGLKGASQDEQDTARSLFSKKYRGKDADGKEYSFNDNEITKLYNMKDRFIDRIS